MVDISRHSKALQEAAFQVEAAENYLNWAAEVFRAMKETRCPQELKRMAEIGVHLSDAGNMEAGSARMQLEKIRTM